MQPLFFSQRLQKFPPYLFAEIDKEKVRLKKKGIQFIDLSIGDPDILAPRKGIEILSKSAAVKENQKYALDRGKDSFRKSIQEWMDRRFSVKVERSEEILPLLGSKEGLVHFPLGVVNRGEYVLIPSPGYPGYRSGALFAEAQVFEIPLLEENGFLPQLEKISDKVVKKAKLLYLNYPNNPTTALISRRFLKQVVDFCKKRNIIIAYDNAYSELYFDQKPLSILQIPGAKSIAVEFHSCSKTFCMTGFRVGWACGNKNLIAALMKVKTNIDSGIFGAVQDVASYVLVHEQEYVRALRSEIRHRRDLFMKGLLEQGWNSLYCESTFYIWARVPLKNLDSLSCVKGLLAYGIVATAGVGFGKYGEGFIRFALTVPSEVLAQALNIISDYIKSGK